MSVSLASQPAQDLLLRHAGDPASLAGDVFAVGPGVLPILLILGLLLTAAIGHVLGLVWQVVRGALAVLGSLLVALGLVVLVGMAAVRQPGNEPASPAPTASLSTPPPAHRARPAPTRASHPVRPSSPAPLGDPTPR